VHCGAVAAGEDADWFVVLFVAAVCSDPSAAALAAESVVGGVSGAQTGATSQLSTLRTDRIGWEKKENARVATSIQIAADRKNSLGLGKKERNTSDSEAPDCDGHVTAEIPAKQGRALDLSKS